MVVPPANSYELLKEHAWYEYGNEEFQSVMDFDYFFAKGEFIKRKYVTYELVKLIFSILILFFAWTYYRSLKNKSIFQYHYDTFQIPSSEKEKYDLESAPNLSYS